MTDLAVRPPLEPSTVDAAPTVLLVHGAMDRAANFERVRRHLVDLPVVSYDRRGYAGSIDMVAGDRVSRHVGDLLAVLAECSSEPAIVIGHSFGGLVALGAAAHAPERVAAVGAYEPPMPWTDWWGNLTSFTSADTAAEEFFERMIGAEVWTSLPDQSRRLRQAEGPALMADYAAAAHGLDFELSDVLSPVAAAHGSATLARFARSAATIAESAHDATLAVIDGAGHGAHMSHPGAFAAWIRSTAALATLPP